MTVTLIYRCRLCGGWERSKYRGPIVVGELPSFVGRRQEVIPHQCSDKMAGVADFAGVEMVEEKEQP